MKTVYFVTSEEKSISESFISHLSEVIYQNRRFSLGANDTFNNKGEKHIFYSLSKGRKVRFSSLQCEKLDFCPVKSEKSIARAFSLLFWTWIPKSKNQKIK